MAEASRQPESLFAFTRAFAPGYRASDFHAYIASAVDRALQQRCRVCDGTGDSCEGHAYTPLNRLMIFTPPQHGKLVADSTPILTTLGWKTHGELRPGDRVFGPDGCSRRVIAVSEPDVASLEVRFTDGASIRVHPRHEWTIFNRASHRWETRETRDLARLSLWAGRRANYQVQDMRPLQRPDSCLPLPPYVLGAWLGDGTTTKPWITHSPADGAVVAHVEALGFAIRKQYTHRTTGVISTVFDGLRVPLQNLRLWNGPKRIPRAYLLGSVRQRLELLAGLIDTDGHVFESRRRVRIVNTNTALIADVADVVRSLGWRPNIYTVPARTSSSGIVGTLPVHYLGFSPDMAIPTVLPRKRVAAWQVMKRRRGIAAISPCEPEEGRCIEVDAADGLYLVGREMVPTHNSALVSVNAPAFYLATHPDSYWVAASYAETLAARNSRHARNIVRSADYQALYDTRLARDSNSTTEWEFEGHRGGFYAVGVGGALTGRVADVLCIDDPVRDRRDADSDTVRENAWDWWTSVARTRLNPSSVAILTMTRWHYDDLAGRILAAEGRVEEGGDWSVVELPALAGEEDPLGRAPGEPLLIPHHKHADLEAARAWYERTRQAIGPRDWSALYQQRPSLDEDAIFPRAWWGYFDWQELPPAFLYTVQMWDTALKDKTRNDYQACVTLGVTGEAIYVLDVYRARLQYPGLKAQIATRRALWKPTHLLVENKAAGIPVVQELHESIPEIAEWDPGERDKVARAFAVQPRVAAGSVKLPLGADWLESFLEETSQFPTAPHDDMVDAFTGAMLETASLLARWASMRVAGAGIGRGQAWIDDRYVDRDTGRAPSPELVQRRL